MNTVMGSAMTGMLVSLLEARAEGETFEFAAPNQDFVLQRQIFTAVSEAAGVEPQEIAAQARENKTLLEMAALAGRADVLVAYVPSASMGTAIEMWHAYQSDVPVYTISPMADNWVVCSLSDRVFSDMQRSWSLSPAGD